MSGSMLRLICSIVLVALATPTVAAEVQVVTTTRTLASVAEEIGGDRIEVTSLVPGTRDPHFFEARPSDMLTLRRADLLVVVGMQLEIGWVPLLLQGARNARIQREGFVDASEGIEPLEVPVAPSRAEGDVHPMGNPHYWLDPRNLEVVARNIAEGLGRVDPSGAELYTKRLEAFLQRLAEARARWTAALDPYRGSKVVSYHRSWVYFEQWSGIEFTGELEPKPGIPPSPRHLARLSARMQEEDIRLVVHAPYYNPKPARELARRTGARALLLPLEVGGVSGVETVFDLFDTLVEEIAAALSEEPPS